MKHKKCIKLLMGMGMQRNDAAGFAKVYNDILRKGLQNYFPILADCLIPKAPLIRAEQLHTLDLEANYALTEEKARWLAITGDIERYIKEMLVRNLATELLDKNVILFRTEHRRGQIYEMRYSAKVTVVLPRAHDELS